MLQLLLLALAGNADAVVRAAALAPNFGPAGRALPLVAHWNTGGADGLGYSPTWQMEQLDAGTPLLPWFPMPNPGEVLKPADRAALRRCAERRLPVAFLGTQWERLLAVDKRFKDRPYEQNPRAFDAAGKPLHQVSMFGPTDAWRECGGVWGTSPALRDAQALYPEPPRVFLFSNHEHPKFRWDQIEQDRKYLDAHGAGRDGDYKRKVLAAATVERYQALLGGFRETLAPAWRREAKFVAYDALGPATFGRWVGWEKHSLHQPGAFNPEHAVWDGSSSPYYAHNWEAIADDKLISPQVQAMNWIFMLEEARQRHPEYWFELALWDGHVAAANDKHKDYANRGQDYPPERYGGMARFGLWLLRPRVLREFRGHTQKRADTQDYFNAAANAVTEIHNEPVLAEFWRRGTLVANPSRPHPYQALIPDEWKDRPRWFALATDADPPGKWKLETEFPAFALALVLGEAPHRRWLVLAWSPPRDRPGLKVTIPDYQPVTLDATRAGAYHVVDEATGKTTRVR